MKLLVFFAFSGALFSGVVHAQYLRGYAFVGPAFGSGSTSAASNSFGILPPAPTSVLTNGTGDNYLAGIGVEQILGRYVGAGLDFAGIIASKGKASDSTVGSASFNVYGHFKSNSRWDPYVTAGYSVLFRDFTANGGNAGGGLNYWFAERCAVMVEFRELFVQKSSNLVHDRYSEIRVGLSFR